MSTRKLIVGLGLPLATALAAALVWGAGGDGAEGELAARVEAARRSHTVLSPVYTVDRKYRSMMGPYSEQRIELGKADDADGSELLWIVGYRAVMVGPDGETPVPQEFMCHSNLDVDVASHAEALGISPSFSSRLFTLSQGQLEVRFPAGFGLPMRSDESLSLTTQVLNLNLDLAATGEELEVRHKVTVEYVRDAEVGSGMKALFPTSAYGLALLEGDDGYFGVRRPDDETHGPGCMVADSASEHAYEDGMGRKFTGHWVVEPGREVNRTLVTRLMQIPYDTTLHYIAVHLHPFAESLELRDLTTGETLFESAAENFDDHIGLARVDSFSSREGIPVYADHEYELVSVYDNTTDEDQDSMAVMYLYLHDRELDLRRERRR